MVAVLHVDSVDAPGGENVMPSDTEQTGGIQPVWQQFFTSGAPARFSPHPLFDCDYYLRSYPEVAAAGLNPLAHYVEFGYREGRNPHPLFDVAYYQSRNPGLAETGADPLIHYLEEGARNGCSPHPLFDVAHYLATNPDVAASGENPLIHYLREGALTGRSPHPLFDAADYLRRYTDIQAIGMNPLYHYLICGYSEGRVPHPLFDAEFYLSRHPEAADADIIPLVHYLRASESGPVSPHPLFDAAYYLDQHPEVALSGVNPLIHFIREGCARGYSPHPLFDVGSYMRNNEDVQGTGINPLVHYINFGFREGRAPHPIFDSAHYSRQNPDTEKTGYNPLLHYLMFGSAQKLDPHPLFDTAYYRGQDPDGLSDGDNPLIHYILEGARAGYNPHPMFDTDHYLTAYADVRRSGLNPLHHYLSSGYLEGRNPHPAFDTKFYLLGNQDVRDSGLNPLVHFISSGAREGRVPNGMINSVTFRQLVFRSDCDWDRIPAFLSRAMAVKNIPVLKSSPEERYQEFMVQHQRTRAQLYPVPSNDERSRGILTFVTTVYDTPVHFVQKLVDSLLGQLREGMVEWFILDNGSSEPAVLALLDDLSCHLCITVHRVEQNLGIIGGMRYCLDHARGQYILPLDSDDVLSSDCVDIILSTIYRENFPDILYTDEDKLIDSHAFQAYFKPDWDPVLFVNSCFIAHLTVIRRDRALELGCYSDPAAEGSHDWDSFTRFLLAGVVPVHIPEVVYSWRIHQASTAGNINSKPVVFDSQKAVLSRFIAGQARSRDFELRKSPLFQNTPDWWIAGNETVHRPILTVVVGDYKGLASRMATDGDYFQLSAAAPLAMLRPAAAAAAARGALVHIMGDAEVDENGWEVDVQTLFALFPDTAVVGGRLFVGNKLVAGGSFFGFGRGCDCPDAGRSADDPGYFAQMWKQHSVSAVSAQNMVVDGAFLANALEALESEPATIHYLGAWLGLQARQAQRRVVYTPFMRGTLVSNWDSKVTDIQRAAFIMAARHVMPDNALYSRHLSLSSDHAYEPVPQARRSQHLASLLRWAATVLDIGMNTTPLVPWLDMAVPKRQAAYPVPAQPPRFSILTTIYVKSDAALLLATAQSVKAQTLAPFEWILLAHGPITADMQELALSLAREGTVRFHTLPVNLGIMGGMRWCLERAQGDYIIPLDSDDLLTPDALQILAASAVENQQPWMLYSDESLLIQGTPAIPYFRPSWDPVFNLTSSYIWHLCALRRDKALEIGQYSDPETELCHDWDTAVRQWQAGGHIHHVPEILYFWRQHEASSTNSGSTDNSRSLQSCNQLLNRVVGGASRPDLYTVDDFPIFRGARELFIRRKRVGGPAISAIILRQDAAPACLDLGQLGVLSGYPFQDIQEMMVDQGRLPADRLERLIATIEAPYIAIVDGRGIPLGDYWVWEALSHFELHQDVVAVSGRAVSEEDIVIAGGEVFDAQGRLRSPYCGLGARSPGPMAMALKAQSVDSVNLFLAVISVPWLKRVLGGLAGDVTIADLPVALGLAARLSGQRAVFSPLMDMAMNELAILGSPLVAGNVQGNARLVADMQALARRRNGAAGYADWAGHVAVAQS